MIAPLASGSGIWCILRPGVQSSPMIIFCSQGCDVMSCVSGRTKRTNLIWFCIWFRDQKYLYQSQPCCLPALNLHAHLRRHRVSLKSASFTFTMLASTAQVSICFHLFTVQYRLLYITLFSVIYAWMLQYNLIDKPEVIKIYPWAMQISGPYCSTVSSLIWVTPTWIF